MLLQIDCQPKQVADITLSFDDGTRKYVTLRPGLYAEFTYRKCGIVETVQGKVVGVYAPSVHPNRHIHREPSSFVCPPVSTVEENRERRIFISVETQSKTVDIEVLSILDVRTIFETVRGVSSPDDETQIQLIRNNRGFIEFSLDGSTWNTVTMIDEGINTKIDDAITAAMNEYKAQIEELNTKIAELEAKLSAGPTDPNGGSTTTTTDSNAGQSGTTTTTDPNAGQSGATTNTSNGSTTVDPNGGSTATTTDPNAGQTGSSTGNTNP